MKIGNRERTKIRDYIELANQSLLKDPVVRFLELEDWMSEFYDNLDESLTYSKEKLQSHANDRKTLTLFLLYALYHQLRLILHMSIVPQFSGQDIPNAISPSMITTSSRTVVTSAQAISGLASDILMLDIDVSRLSPFTGHCTYVAACVHVSLLAADGLKRFQAWNDIVPACRVLKGMSPYWIVLQGLVRFCLPVSSNADITSGARYRHSLLLIWTELDCLLIRM